MKHQTYEVIEADKGIRLDVLVARELAISRAFAQQLIKEEKVYVNDCKRKANYRLDVGQMVAMEPSQPTELCATPENIPLDILYEDEHLIVVNKPRGMVVHPAPGNPAGTLVNALLYHCQGSLSGINGRIRPGIVHRLDKDTSGVMVVAKTDVAHRHLAEQIKAHTAKRTYWALVHGTLAEMRGTIEAPIGRHPKDRIKMAVNLKNGREAITHFTVQERYRMYTWIACQLETGRTHQIRVHLAYIGHPVVNDPVYGYKRDAFPIQGQVLHSYSLQFIHPITGEKMDIKALPATDFMACLQQAATQR